MRKTWRYAAGAITASLLALATPMAVAEAITHVLPGSGSQASAIQAEEDGARKQEGGAENSAMCRAMVYSLMGASLIVGTANLLGGRRNNQFAGGD